MEKTQFVRSAPVKADFKSGTKFEELNEQTHVVVLQSKENLDLVKNSESHNFISEDLQKSGFAWVYQCKSRVLLVLNQKPTPIALRKQAVDSIEKLRDIKASNATIYITQDMDFTAAKHFIQGFMMWNYQFEMKSLPGVDLLKNISICFEKDLSDQEKCEAS